MKPKWRKRYVDLGQYVLEDASYRHAWWLRYGMVVDVTFSDDPAMSIIEDVWKDRQREQSQRNVETIRAMNNRLPYMRPLSHGT